MVYGRKKKIWQPEFRLLGFTDPKPVPQGDYYSRRKYYLTIWYQDGGVSKTKKIYFGLKGLLNKIDGNQTLTKRKRRQDKFHAFFWEDLLLNSENTLEKAIAKARKTLLK